MNKKRKQRNRFAILSLLFFSLVGGLLIYRSGISDSQFRTYQGTLEKAEISKGFGNYGRNYAILLDFKDLEEKLGLYGGTKEQAVRKLSSLELHTGTNYRLFIDKSVSYGLNGINLGIRKIMKGTEVIYNENMLAHKVFGLLFILLGMIPSTTFYLIAKRKFK